MNLYYAKYACTKQNETCLFYNSFSNKWWKQACIYNATDAATAYFLLYI
jgi:hypothetical protein